MKNYKEIHIWDFPPKLTFVKLKDKFRLMLFSNLISFIGSQQKFADLLSKLSLRYDTRRAFIGRGNIYSWIEGKKFDRGKIKNVNTPLWVLIESSKLLSNSKIKQNIIMQEIEQNIEYYAGWGKSNVIIKPKLPIYVTPEMVSIIFHFLGDGHIGKKGVCSSYTQINKEGLNNFLSKLQNIFGYFDYDKKAFENGHVIIPKILTELYNYYFNLPSTDTFESYIPSNIKSLDNKFLLAGLASFMVDEANLGEIIEIYSKNHRLLSDIRQIAVNCGYSCREIRKKYRYGVFDSYRFLISSSSYLKIYEDISVLTEKFPLCGLAHKTKRLKIMVKRKERSSLYEKDGVTKNNILNLIKVKPRTISELAEILNYGNSSIREHLWKLEKNVEIVRKRNIGRNILWSIK